MRFKCILKRAALSGLPEKSKYKQNSKYVVTPNFVGSDFHEKESLTITNTFIQLFGTNIVFTIQNEEKTVLVLEHSR